MKPAYVYLKYCPQLELYKVGVSVNCKQRNKNLQTGNPYEIITIDSFYSQYPYRVEMILHFDFKLYKQNIDEVQLKGEWFNLPKDQADKFLTKCESAEKDIDLLVKSDNHFVLK